MNENLQAQVKSNIISDELISKEPKKSRRGADISHSHTIERNEGFDRLIGIQHLGCYCSANLSKHKIRFFKRLNNLSQIG